MSAFDDNICISAPCETELEGGLNGTILTSTVDRSIVGEVNVKLTNNAVTFSLGKRINLKLPVMAIESRPFVMPEPKKAAVLDVDRAVFDHALKFCMQSIGHDVTHPEWCGVTFEVAGKNLLIYSGYSQVLAQATVPLMTAPKFKRVILHEKFCQQVLHYPKATLELHNDHGLIDLEGKVRVFGRALTGAGGLDLGDMISIAVERAKTFVEMPDINRMLGRAMLFEGDHLNMQLAVVDGKAGKRIKMVSASGEGELVDYSKAISDDHDEIEVATNAKHLHSGASLSEICIGPDEIVMRGNDGASIIQVVSVSTR